VSLDDDLAEVVARLAPVIAAVRGQDLATKRRVTASLSSAARSVFAWYSFHAHAGTGDGSVDDVSMFRQLCELYVVHWDVWDEVEQAADDLGVVDLVTTFQHIRACVDAAPGVTDGERWRTLSRDHHATTPASARAALRLLGPSDVPEPGGR
jgi:hypothetical protein